MATETESQEQESPAIRALAERLDYLTDGQLQELADVKATTTEAWRRRRQGPDYVRLGNNIFYPRAGVQEFLAKRVTPGTSPVAAGVL